jgi:thioredoxin-like negative regulator of GroEL
LKKNRILLIGILIAIIATISFAVMKKQTPVTQGISQLIENDKPVIYELGSNSCSSCIAMIEVMKKVEANHKDNIQVIKIDVFQDKKSTEPFNIRAIPTQIVRDKNGKEIYRHEGFISYEALTAQLAKLGILSQKIEGH